jgi:hypothetical protein
MTVISSVCVSQAGFPSASDRVPVLVELFTSEGCSTCPPADRFLESLDGQPIPGIEVIVLSEHVDYWNHLGWKDPYSSRDFSERQAVYARHFQLPDVYTPQMVVDGSRQLGGSKVDEVQSALQEARTQPKTEVRITDIVVDHARLRVHIESAPLNFSKRPRSLGVYLAIALNRAESQVARGENANRHLTHTAVVRKMARVGSVKAGEHFSQEVELKIGVDTDPSNLRVVAFLQDLDSGRVCGVAMKHVEQPRADSTKDPSAQGVLIRLQR